MSGRYHVHVRTPNKKPTVEQQRQQHKAALLQACKEGRHSKTPTFRPSETVCLGCGVIFYCPGCFKQHELTPAKHTHVLWCFTHRQAGVQA